MPITITFNDIDPRGSGQFHRGLERLYAYDRFTQGTRGRVRKIYNGVAALRKEVAETFQKEHELLLEKYAKRVPEMIPDPTDPDKQIEKKDDEGNVVTKPSFVEEGGGKRYDLADIEGFEKEFAELRENFSIEIQANQIPYAEWKNMPMSTAEEDALEKLLEPAPEEGGDKPKLEAVKK